MNSKELYLGLPGQTLSFDQSAAGVKLDYTQTCGFKTFYEYTLLSEMEPWKTEVSFYGYVITADEPSPTKGEHWKMCIKITDRTLLERAKARGISSWPMITVIVFANGEENAFPRNLTTWDIIRCHRASVQMFDNRLQIMLSPKFHSAFTCFSGDPNSSIEAIFSSSKKYTWTEFDSEVISHMRQQRVIMQNMLRSVHDMDNSIAVRQAPRARTMYCLSDNAIPELHFSTIKCIKRHSSPIMLFKARVKVVDYFPKNIEDFVKVFCTRCRRSSTSMDGSPCPSCNSVDYIQLHLVLMFRLQDTSGDLLCILQGKAAVRHSLFAFNFFILI